MNMESTYPTHICWALVLAAILNLDRLALGQNAFWRPLVAGLIIGLLVGQVRLGLTLGLWVEVLWLGRPPLGGAIIPNGALALSAALVGLAGSLSFLNLPPDPQKPLAPLALGLIIPLAHYMTSIEPMTRRWGEFSHNALAKALENDLAPQIWKANLVGIGLTFSLALAFSLFGALVMALISVIALSAFPQWFWQTLVKLQFLIPILCFVYMGLYFNRSKLNRYALTTVITLILLSILSVAL
ncbi:MAG: PTS sugar transporter subunit IIC [Deltaproteobacteria bacterium]|jgi:PTS system mannose-specific IIC component|nr:PTS sugar transporter subunit IIC [Deltaproteobacteria bacterium]